MEKSSVVWFFAFLAIVFLASFVLAQEGAFEATTGILQGFKDFVVNQIITPLLGPNVPLPRIFLAILLFMVIYSIVNRIFLLKNLFGGWGGFIIAGLITALPMMLLTEDFVSAIALQYEAMGAAILSIIPFAIMLSFTATIGSLLLARIAWIFYVFYYFMIYLEAIWARGANWWSPGTLPYIAAIAAGIVIFVFIKGIRNIFSKGKLEAKEERAIKDIGFRKLGRGLEREETRARTDVE